MPAFDLEKTCQSRQFVVRKRAVDEKLQIVGTDTFMPRSPTERKNHNLLRLFCHRDSPDGDYAPGVGKRVSPDNL